MCTAAAEPQADDRHPELVYETQLRLAQERIDQARICDEAGEPYHLGLAQVHATLAVALATEALALAQR